jgi:N-acetylmuramic acid 6-phosphate etherase
MAFEKITEKSSLYDNLDTMSPSEIVKCMNQEDRKPAEAVEKALPQISELVERLVPRMKEGGRLFYIGAGTSGRLGVLDASEIPPTFGMPATTVIGLIAGGDTALRNPVEGAEDDTEQGWMDLMAHNINDKDTLVGIAASGTTPYVIGALREARKNGVLTASIACNPDSPMAQEAEIAIEIMVGPEFVTGSSRMKAGTAQKMTLNMISTAAMIGLGRVKGNRMINMQLSNAKLVDRVTRMIVDSLGIPYDQAQQLLLLHGSVAEVMKKFPKE